MKRIVPLAIGSCCLTIGPRRNQSGRLPHRQDLSGGSCPHIKATHPQRPDSSPRTQGRFTLAESFEVMAGLPSFSVTLVGPCVSPSGCDVTCSSPMRHALPGIRNCGDQTTTGSNTNGLLPRPAGDLTAKGLVMQDIFQLINDRTPLA
jgi:hypothetical protein